MLPAVGGVHRRGQGSRMAGCGASAKVRSNPGFRLARQEPHAAQGKPMRGRRGFLVDHGPLWEPVCWQQPSRRGTRPPRVPAGRTSRSGTSFLRPASFLPARFASAFGNIGYEPHQLMIVRTRGFRTGSATGGALVRSLVRSDRRCSLPRGRACVVRRPPEAAAPTCSSTTSHGTTGREPRRPSPSGDAHDRPSSSCPWHPAADARLAHRVGAGLDVDALLGRRGPDHCDRSGRSRGRGETSSSKFRVPRAPRRLPSPVSPTSPGVTAESLRNGASCELGS